MAGSDKYESTATNFNDGRRVFVYRKWNGETFVIANEVTSTESKVYKLKIGTDSAFQLLFTSTIASISTSAASPGAGTNEAVGTVAWTSPSNILTSNDTRASAALTAGQTTQRLLATGFNFNIPSDATIVGITAEVERSASLGSHIIDQSIILLKNLSFVGNNSGSGSFWPTTDAYATYGGSSDLWGTTWTPQEVNASGFGLLVRAACGTAATAMVDHVRMTITYSLTGAAFDFVVANDTLYFSNGIDKRSYDGVNVYPWGVTAPTATPTTALTGTGITASVGWRYCYVYKNSTRGSISSISPYSTSTGAVSNQTVQVTATVSSETGVDAIEIYRTTDGGFDTQGNGRYFFIAELPNISSSFPYNDTTADASLDTALSEQAPPLNYNDPPPGMRGLKYFANRIWGFAGNTLYYTGWEEITNGTEEECIPSGVTGNNWSAAEEIMALSVLPDALLIKTRNTIYKVTGDSRDTFSFLPLFKGMGTSVKVTGVAEDGDRVFWMNTDGQIWATDGTNKSLVSEPITDDLLNIASTDCSMAVHRYGKAQWLVVADANGDTTGANGAKWYVLDLNTGKWMPPWSRSATHLYSGELAAGQFSLIYMSYDGGSAGQTIVRRVSISPHTETWTDTGVADYTANMVLAPQKLAKQGFNASLVYIGYEKDLRSTPAADPTVSFITDEIESGSEATATQVDPPSRRTSATIQEKWCNAVDAKQFGTRALVKFAWSAENKNFRLLSLDYAFKNEGGED